MAMVGVVSGSLYRRTHSLRRLAWTWVGGRLAPFYIHQMNRVNDPYPQFQGHAIFDAEYLRNGTTYRHSFNEILTGTYTRPTQQCHFV